MDIYIYTVAAEMIVVPKNEMFVAAGVLLGGPTKVGKRSATSEGRCLMFSDNKVDPTHGGSRGFEFGAHQEALPEKRRLFI